jgi:hypothetical protein
LDLAASGDKEEMLTTQNYLFGLLNKQQFYNNFVVLNSISCTVQRKKRFSSSGKPTQHQHGCTAKKKLAALYKESVFLRL